MPRYRQASPYSFMSGSENGRSARLLAYSDVRRAFNAYLAKAKPDRPFIIAGYGQGAMYGMKLLAEMKPAHTLRFTYRLPSPEVTQVENVYITIHSVPTMDLTTLGFADNKVDLTPKPALPG